MALGKLEEVRQRLLASVPEFAELVWDYCTEVDMRGVRAEVRVGDYRVYLVDPVVCRKDKSTLWFRDAVAVAAGSHEARRVLWFRRVEVPGGVEPEAVSKVVARLGKLADRFLSLYLHPPDLARMLAESGACEEPAAEPSEGSAAVELLRYGTPFGSFSLTLAGATYRCRGGAELALRDVLVAAVDDKPRVIGFGKQEARI